VTEELLTFHEAVNHMQEQEEELISYHSQLAEVSKYSMVYDLVHLVVNMHTCIADDTQELGSCQIRRPGLID